jgi:hypothetical protein
MKFLKGLALSLLGFLLLVSLYAFGLVFTLNNTLLNPDFVVSELDRFDISGVVQELLGQELLGTVASQTEIPQELMTEALNDTITELEPWLKEQLSDSIYSVYDYFQGREQSLSVSISLEPVKEALRDNLWEAFSQSLPPELAMVPPAEIERYFNESYEEFAKDFPSAIEFDESSLSPETRSQLGQVKQYISYIQTAFKILIGVMVLLILGIIFIDRQVKGITRRIGSVFLTYAIPACITIFAVQYFDKIQAWVLDLLKIDVAIPAQFQDLILQSVNNFLAPIRVLSIGILIAGVALIVVSFVYKPHQAAD